MHRGEHLVAPACAVCYAEILFEKEEKNRKYS